MNELVPTIPAPWKYLPARAPEIPLLVSIPHTGTGVPPEIAAQFADPALASSAMADWHLHELYNFLPDLGVDVIHATYHRFVVDLNRPPDATPLYPGRFETGLVPTQTFQGEPIWRSPPSAADITHRLKLHHEPYHLALLQRLHSKVATFGHCYLIDAHSVESRANQLHGALTKDIYLGDRDGKTCAPAFMAAAEQAFTAHGLAVSRNEPYKGGYITAHYCGVPNVQTLQIEMCQRLYMAEGQPAGATRQPLFKAFQSQLQQIAAEIARFATAA
jgi:N-formylglutamate deformylase